MSRLEFEISTKDLEEVRKKVEEKMVGMKFADERTLKLYRYTTTAYILNLILPPEQLSSKTEIVEFQSEVEEEGLAVVFAAGSTSWTEKGMHVPERTLVILKILGVNYETQAKE